MRKTLPIPGRFTMFTGKAEIIERIDDREDYGELRFIALGRVEADIYRVVYTWRGEGVVRIITAQKASRHEREIYFREIFT